MSDEQESSKVGILACIGIILILIGALVKMSTIPMILFILFGSICFCCLPIKLLEDYLPKQAERTDFSHLDLSEDRRDDY